MFGNFSFYAVVALHFASGFVHVLNIYRETQYTIDLISASRAGPGLIKS